MKSRKSVPSNAAALDAARTASPELSAVIRSLAASSSRKTRLTLAKVRAAMQGPGVTWSREGELLFPQDRTALLIELDELIDAHGARSDALALLPRPAT